MEELNLKQTEQLWHGSPRTYAIGFLSSIILTLISFSLVYFELMSGVQLGFVLGGLALVQAIIQVRYFLHLGEEGSPFWETIIFAFMILILLIVVLGTLWIMFDLHTRVMGNFFHD
ncbi:MAG: cytochrome o ubiquinol oxidase subunit IV [Chlamydiia bacterium]|nr:cytochrome o ubiquinol oxidase subunit IV [Chlamydiia bacterium]